MPTNEDEKFQLSQQISQESERQKVRARGSTDTAKGSETDNRSDASSDNEKPDRTTSKPLATSKTADTIKTSVKTTRRYTMIDIQDRERILANTAVKSAPKQSWYYSKAKTICRHIAEHKGFIIFGMVLTLWALIGDDLRLFLTSKPIDDYFNGVVLFCLAFFTSEIVVSCLGVDDYFLGFFFWLDCLATATLILDHTDISDFIFGGGLAGGNSDDDYDKAKASKTARIGAKMGRIVRVIRLVRIVKLYKVFAASKKPKQHNLQDWDMDELADLEEEKAKRGHVQESLVGKKLSAKTTQHTIILVLTMLMVLPLLQVDSSLRMPAAAYYGADDVRSAFLALLDGTGSRDMYEKKLLRYVYYHNWFNRRDRNCPRDSLCSSNYYSRNFWVGIGGSGDENLLRLRASQAQLRKSTVDEWEARVRDQNDLYNFGSIPPEARSKLWSNWTTECTKHGQRHYGISFLEDSIDNFVSYRVRCPSEDLRLAEFSKYAPNMVTTSQYSEWHFAFYFDRREYTKEEAMYSLLTTAFVVLVLCVASVFFSKDANSLVLEPVEHMMTTVEAIRANPLQAMKMADDEFKQEEMLKKQKKQREQNRRHLDNLYMCCRPNKTELMETVILEKTIIKLASLLALGFGEAGSNIVSHTMKNAHSAAVDAMIEGSRVDCILGNCRIRDFSIATEVLQGKVMTFVNQISEIVHGVVDEFHGAANKNNGDTFLIVWLSQPEKEIQKLAEMSVVAFAVILGAVHRSPMLADYRHHPGLQQRMAQHRNDCRVNVSFGLHRGWAIEGAVGSEFKIDVSYLSPNVSIAASVERAAEVYGVSIIASQSVVQLCTREMAQQMRLIDKVVIKGSIEPQELYSVDLNYKCLDVESRREENMKWNTHQRFKARQILANSKEKLWRENTSLAGCFDTISDIASMRRLYNNEFLNLFNMGFQNYAQGEWQAARSLLRRTETMLGSRDGPSTALLMFVGKREAPKGWKGVRNLDIEDEDI